ncbi:hemerythrin-like, Thioredoxin-like fold protein [Artemisia annua]|uniref:Hemerythrin-like, Thioredoxin-like fold protein n=1 Tax=Artemisia annua TaxID=35608 RepID=A0A2U1NNK6_ARTAN|nr:hemerythrin-like, Thioredoxin-like fold protein [Artemisia annua]
MGNCSKTLKKTNPDNFTPSKNKSNQTHQKSEPPPPYRKVDISDVLNPPPAPSILFWKGRIEVGVLAFTIGESGLSKTVTEEHARDLPLMNGIKEDIKTIIVLDTGSASCSDAIYSLSTRIKSLLENCKEHFDEEERGILPLMEAAELTQGQQEKLLEQSLDVMPSTHSHLLKFFMEGLQPQEAMLYLDLITRCTDKDRAGSIYRFLVEGNDYGNGFRMRSNVVNAKQLTENESYAIPSNLFPNFGALQGNGGGRQEICE